MKVKEIMSADPKFCSPDNNLSVVAALMWENDCGVIPVVDDESRVLGMITDRDICIAVCTKNRPASALSVREAMSKDAYDCFEDADVREALKVFRDVRVHRLPVVDKDGILKGILSLNDIVLAAEESKSAAIPYDDVVKTFKAVYAHRLPKIIEKLKTVSV